MLMPSDIIVLDTEGADTLTEIAIVDIQGNLIYEAFTADNSQVRFNTKPLETIVSDLEIILANKRVVCHSVTQDSRILAQSFKKFNQKLPLVQFICTVKLAKEIYPYFPNYSLKYLAKKLFLKVNNQVFREVRAHSARYDALFTLQLYSHCLSMSNELTLPEFPQSPVNPFNSNRVDNPFQNHLDFNSIYQEEFTYLCSILEEIKSDVNQQSKGCVIIGEAGSGKTHL